MKSTFAGLAIVGMMALATPGMSAELLTIDQMDTITAGYRPDLTSSWGARYDYDARRYGLQTADGNAHTREYSTSGQVWIDDGGKGGYWGYR